MKIKINTEVIAKLDTCKDRFKNWIKHYNHWNGDIAEFLNLDKISYRDKMWVASRLMPISIAEVFAIDCAVSVATHADDDRYTPMLNNAYYATAYAQLVVSLVHPPFAADAADFAVDAICAATVYASDIHQVAARANAARAAAALMQHEQLQILSWLIETYDPKEWS